MVDFNPLSGRASTTSSLAVSDDKKVCEECGVQGDRVVEITIEEPPVDEESLIASSAGPFACDEHIEAVKRNHQCCLTPEYKVHQADADANIVEIVECKNCGDTIEFPPTPK